MPIWGLVLATVGGLWLCLWRTRWRLFGIPVVVAGLASIALVRGPDILISDDGRLMAVRGADGELQLSSSRAGGLKRETWLRRAGQSGEAAPTWPSAGLSDDGRLRCDAAGCVYTVPGHIVALARTESALAEDCLRASVLIAAVPVRGACPSPRLVIDRFAVWRDGSHAVWLDADGDVRVQSVRAERGDRPWVPPLPKPRKRAGRGRL
jgi:competence protein ComEC